MLFLCGSSVFADSYGHGGDEGNAKKAQRVLRRYRDIKKHRE